MKMRRTWEKEKRDKEGKETIIGIGNVKRGMIKEKRKEEMKEGKEGGKSDVKIK